MQAASLAFHSEGESPDYDSTAVERRNSLNGSQEASSPTARTMSQGSYQPKTPP